MALDSSLALLQGLPGKTPKSMVDRVAHELAGLPISGSLIATQPPIALPRIWSDGHSSDLILYVPAKAAARMGHVVHDLRAAAETLISENCFARSIPIRSGLRSSGLGVRTPATVISPWRTFC